MIDLHTHSTFSDGSDRPAELARRAHEIGLRAIALTDHDTTASHDEMAAACAEHRLEYVTGVEVSLRDNAFPQVHRDTGLGPRNVHVLAYFVPLDPAHPFQRALASLRHDRDVRNEALVSLLVDEGFERLTLDYLAGIAGNVHSIGRPHFARALFELHPEIVGPRNDETWSRVFTEWLGATGRAYVPKTSMPVEEFVAATRGSGAVLAIAHPLDNYLDGASTATLETTMAPVLASLRERGFVGVEAYYGSWSAAARARMVKATRDAGMIPTGGSDYHGHYKENVRLGVGLTGDLRVPDEVLDELRAAHEG